MIHPLCNVIIHEYLYLDQAQAVPGQVAARLLQEEIFTF